MLLFRCHFGKSTSTATKKHAADRRRKGKNADGEKEEERKCRQCELVNSTSTLREYGKGCCSVLVVFWCRNHTKMCWWEESLQRLHQICMQCQLKSSHIECEVLVCACVCMKNVNYVSLNSRQSRQSTQWATVDVLGIVELIEEEEERSTFSVADASTWKFIVHRLSPFRSFGWRKETLL